MNTQAQMDTSGMNVFVKVKQVYGNTLYYPACNKSEIFAAIAQSKTLTAETINQVKSLGYNVQPVFEEPKL